MRKQSHFFLRNILLFFCQVTKVKGHVLLLPGFIQVSQYTCTYKSVIYSNQMLFKGSPNIDNSNFISMPVKTLTQNYTILRRSLSLLRFSCTYMIGYLAPCPRIIQQGNLFVYVPPCAWQKLCPLHSSFGSMAPESTPRGQSHAGRPSKRVSF